MLYYGCTAHAGSRHIDVQIMSLIFSLCVAAKHILISPDLKSVKHETTHIILPSEKIYVNKRLNSEDIVVLNKPNN